MRAPRAPRPACSQPKQPAPAPRLAAQPTAPREAQIHYSLAHLYSCAPDTHTHSSTPSQAQNMVCKFPPAVPLLPLLLVAVPALAAGAAAAEDKESWEGEKGKVQFVGDDTWDQFRMDNPKAITMFYAPWCGHCKALKPHYAAASVELESVFSKVNEKVAISAIDCTVELEVCKQYDVKGYPQVLYFGTSTAKGEEYKQARAKKELMTFIALKVDPSYEFVLPEFVNKPLWENDSENETKGLGNGKIVHLTDEHFWHFRAKTPMLFTMFYDPSCPHCKELKPEFIESSVNVKDKDFVFAAVDCTTQYDTCSTVGASSWPQMRFMKPIVRATAHVQQHSARWTLVNTGCTPRSYSSLASSISRVVHWPAMRMTTTVPSLGRAPNACLTIASPPPRQDENSTEACRTVKGEDFGSANGGRTVEWIAGKALEEINAHIRSAAQNVDKNTNFKKMRLKSLKKILRDRGQPQPYPALPSSSPMPAMRDDSQPACACAGHKCSDCTDKSDFIRKILTVIDDPVIKKPAELKRCVLPVPLLAPVSRRCSCG